MHWTAPLGGVPVVATRSWKASNWAALTAGSHLPFWPLYVWWAVGIQAFPTALLTVSLTPVFLAIPWLSRRSGLLGRMTMLMVGILNTLLTTWVLGVNSGTELFLAPCAALAAISFRRSERWILLILAYLRWWSGTRCAIMRRAPSITTVRHRQETSSQ